MNDFATKIRVSQKRRRNFVAKKLREDARFKQRVQQRKRIVDEEWKPWKEIDIEAD